MKAHFEAEVEALNRRIRGLAGRVAEQVRAGADAVARGDEAAATAVAAADEWVDREEVLVEEECLKIMALYAPVADELRYVFGLTKVNHELERIGDLAKRAAGQAGRMKDLSVPETAQQMLRLSQLTVNAVVRVIEAFVTRNDDEARSIWAADATINELHERLMTTIEARLGQPGADVFALLAARSVVSAFERIGDHVTRIAKIVIYMRRGEIMRHRPVPEARARVLFICVRNSARSQMAAAWLTHLYGDRFEAESAGLEPGTVHPLAVAVMREVGLDISGNRTQSVFDLVKAGRLYSHVITVCDEASGERCPVFAGITRRENWSFPDPAAFSGTPQERLAAMRAVRDAIRDRIEAWEANRPDSPVSG
jgi:arsenate reductase